MTCEVVEHEVYKGSDNSFTLELNSRDYQGVVTPIDLSTVQTMSLELEGQPLLVVNYQEGSSTAIDWWDVELLTGYVRFRLGAWASINDIPLGTYTARLISYDLVNTNGIVWTSHADRALYVTINA